MKATRDAFSALFRVCIRQAFGSGNGANHDRTFVQPAHRPSEFKERTHENKYKAQYLYFPQFQAHRRREGNTTGKFDGSFCCAQKCNQAY